MNGDSSGRSVRNIPDWYLHAVDRIASAIWTLSIGLMVFLVLLVFGRVVGRYVFDFVPIWAPELSRFLAIWISLLLAGVLIYENNHLNVTILYRKLPLKWKEIMAYVHLALISVVGLIFTYYGYFFAFEQGTRSVAPGMRIDLIYVYIIVPISGVLIVVCSIARAIEINRDPDILEAQEREFEKQRLADEQRKAEAERERVEATESAAQHVEEGE